MNILFIFSDQQQRYALGCMGHPDIQTPHLDALAARGVLFRRCYANDPVCGPFRGSLLTGQYTSRCRVTGNASPLPADRTTFAEAFKAGGFRTSYVGKWHLGGNGNGPIAAELRGGFEHFIGYQCYNGYYRDVCFYDEAGSEHRFDRHRTDVATDLACARLTQLAGDPFLMMVSYQAPHYPVQPAPEFAARYAHRPVHRRANCQEVDPFTRTWSPPSPWPPDDDPDYQRYGNDLDEYLRLYFAMCTQIDANVGRLLQTLDDLGVSQDTAVIYTSDHGDMQGSHGLINKCLPHEESAGIPLIAAVPGGSSGQVCDALVSGIDYLPTCLELAGLPPVDGVDGTSFAPLLRGEEQTRGPIFAERGDRWCMVVRGPWKLAAKRGDELTPMLMTNLDDDPFELHNLITDDRFGELRQELLAELSAWDREVRS